MLAALSLGACTPDGSRSPSPFRPASNPSTSTDDASTSPLAAVETPELIAPENVLFARELRARTTRPTWLTVQFTDGTHTEEIAFAGLTDDHRVPLLGFKPGRTYVLTLTLTDELGEVLRFDGKEVQTADLPQPWPQFEVVEADASRMEPGFTLLSLRAPGREGTERAIVLDSASEVRWLLSFPEPVTDLTMLDDGTLLALEGGHVVHYDILGEELERWVADSSPNIPAGARSVPGPGQFHHEVDQNADGSFVTLMEGSLEVPNYPLSYTDPGQTAEATIADDELVVFAPDGTVTTRLSMLDLFDYRRIGYDSLSLRGDELDWAHSNAVHWDPVDAAWLVSMRHQDAVAKIAQDGELVWILGNHDNWAPSLRPYLLDPADGMVWPYHQHAAMTTDTGTVLLFDNHNEGASPFTAQRRLDPEEIASRLVEYRIQDGVVEQVWEYRETALGHLYSGAMGDADILPQTGNILGVWGWSDHIDGRSNSALGLGNRSIHLIEVSHEEPAAVARHLHIYADAADQFLGWTCNRAEWIPSPYGHSGPRTY